MSQPASAGHNQGPPLTLAELIPSDVVADLIDAELAKEPLGVDGQKVPSIKDRDPQLEGSCRRFLAAYPKIETDEAEQLATAVLSACVKFAGGSGRIEIVRKALKQPVWDAGVEIDKAFVRFGLQLGVRPLMGPAAGRRKPPYTLAEKIANLLADRKDEKARITREAAQKLADDKAAEAAMAEKLASSGSGMVTMADAAEAARVAEKHQAVASAPMNTLTKTSGGEFGSSSGKRVRTFEITDAALVPRQFCVPSESLIRAAVGTADGPMPTIPGVTIKDMTDLTVRR